LRYFSKFFSHRSMVDQSSMALFLLLSLKDV